MKSPAASWTLSDRFGVGLSGLCLVHCALTPLVWMALPLWATAEPLHGLVHPLLAVFVTPVTLWAVWHGYRTHGRLRAPVLLGVGLGTLLAAEWMGHSAGPHAEIGLALLGSGLLIGGHFANRRPRTATAAAPTCRRCS